MLLIGIFLVIFSFSGCQKIEDVVFNISSSVTTPQYASTPVTVYSTPLPHFESMQFAWFYKPPGNSSDLGAIAENFSLIILTRNDEREREEINNMGNNSPVLQYLRAEAIIDPSSCTEKPFQNQIANLEGDYCLIKNQHPDWLLKDINGNLIQYDHSDYVFMDPGNAEWQAYYLEKITGFQKDPGWKGLFLDNVDGGLGRFEKMHLLLGNYSDGQSYQTAIRSFLQYLFDNYFSASEKVLYANIPYLEDNNVWFEYLEYLDGGMLEAFAADWNTGYLSTDTWLGQLELAEKTQAQGKTVILVTQGNINDTQRMQFGLASFLLINNGQAYFRYSNDEAYRDLWWFAQYELDLGQPVGHRYQNGDVWQRDFENGSVIVNPENHSSEIQID